MNRKHRAGNGIDRVDLVNPVVFLRRPGQLVLFNSVFGIGIHRCGNRNSGLGFATGRDPINVETGRRISD